MAAGGGVIFMLNQGPQGESLCAKGPSGAGDGMTRARLQAKGSVLVVVD